MSKANVAHETLVRAREADKRREAELRIEARQQRQINERIQEANHQLEMTRTKHVLTARSRRGPSTTSDMNRLIQTLETRHKVSSAAQVESEEPAPEIRGRNLFKVPLKELARVKDLLSKRGKVKEKVDVNALKELYAERAKMKEEERKEKEAYKEKMEEAAFLYRLKKFELYPPTPRRRGSRSPSSSRGGSPSGTPRSGSPSSFAGTPGLHTAAAGGSKSARRPSSSRPGSRTAKTTESMQIYTPGGGIFTPGALSATSSAVQETPEELAAKEEQKQLEKDIWTFSHSVRQSMCKTARQPLDLTGMVFASQSYTGRAIKNLDRLIISVPMKNDGSCALWGLLDGHHKSTAVSFAHNKLLSCIAEAQRKGLAPRYAVAQGMQTCDQLYLQAPTILTDDRFGSGTGALVVLLHMGTLFTCNLGASRAVVCCAGEAQELSKDHVPNDEREGKRLESGKGGKLSEHGMVVGSFNGKEYTSPITRSIGNAHLKRLGVVTCRAEVSERELSRQDAFLLIASPGLWEVMSSQEAVDHVRRMMVEWPSKIDDVAVKAMCGMLCDEAVDLGAPRSVTVVMVFFADVVKLGLRDLFIYKQAKAKKAADLHDINSRRGDLTPSQANHL